MNFIEVMVNKQRVIVNVNLVENMMETVKGTLICFNSGESFYSEETLEEIKRLLNEMYES